MGNEKSVLITGLSGLIGGLLHSRLQENGGYRVRGLNRTFLEGVECFQGDIGEMGTLAPAFVGQDTVVHLAAQLQDEPWTGILNTNIEGTYNVFEAARLAGVRRVIFASTGSTVRGYENLDPYSALVTGKYDQIKEPWPLVTEQMVWPSGTYGASKLWGEALARHYADTYDMSVLCVRIGVVTTNDQAITPRERSCWLSHRDVVQILVRCLEAPASLRYDIFLATSANRWGYRDISHAKDILGFVPQDGAN